MEWWNDLWLNEGFASFMENVGVRHVHPEWKMMDQFFLDKFQVAMGLDQLSNSHPIMAEVRDPAEISSLFDSISYDKVGTSRNFFSKGYKVITDQGIFSNQQWKNSNQREICGSPKGMSNYFAQWHVF